MREGGRYRKDRATGERVLVERTGAVVPEAAPATKQDTPRAKRNGGGGDGAAPAGAAPAGSDVAAEGPAEGEE